MLFKVLRGSHSEGGKTYRKGEVVDSKSDLIKHNSSGSIKFANVFDDGAKQDAKEAVPSSVATKNPHEREELEALTLPDLKEIAADEEVEIDSTFKKEEIISALLA